jgi:hypothetical protein
LSKIGFEGTVCHVNQGDFDMARKTKTETPPTDDNADLIAQAISEGRALVDQGKSKIEAAMAIYRHLELLPQATIVSAFIEGATLTEKGALTYWYNCRRKLAKERRDQENPKED